MEQKFCVLGNPISHSLSPQIHQLFAQECGIALSYEKILVEGDFEETLKFLQNQGFTGANVTVPFKEEAFLLADEKSTFAQKALAANTLFFQNGKIHAFNTDGMGFLRDVKERLKFEIHNKNILILGAGGAARALLAPLLKESPQNLFLSNRTLEKAQNLAKVFGVPFLKWEEIQNAPPFDFIINATSASLLKESVPLPPFTKNALFYDLFYQQTGFTPFLKNAFQHGAQNGEDGLGMLVFQAALAFEIWHKILPNALSVYDFLKKK